MQGSGDVYVEYAHASTTYASVKDRYVANGLIAMWDGDDNQGTGAHDPSATTWVDLTGRHLPMTFTAAPAVGANFFDVSAGGGYITDAADIAAAVNAVPEADEHAFAFHSTGVVEDRSAVDKPAVVVAAGRGGELRRAVSADRYGDVCGIETAGSVPMVEDDLGAFRNVEDP